MRTESENMETTENRQVIAFTIENRTKAIGIRFPCSERDLEQSLRAIAADAENPPKVYVREVIFPKELTFLTGKYVDVDELNYLAKRMRHFTQEEADKLYAIAESTGYNQPKDLIDFTFNIDRYMLVQEIGDVESIGKEYYSYTGYRTPSLQDCAKKGWELLGSKEGKFTHKGLLFPLEWIEYKPMYAGEAFPYDCDRDDALLEVDVHYRWKTGCVYLPADDRSIQKAIKRLGAADEKACRFQVRLRAAYPHELGFYEIRAWENRLNELLETESIFTVNLFAQRMVGGKLDFHKLSAASQYVGKSDLSTLLKLTEHLTDFEYLQGAADYKAVGGLALKRAMDTALPLEAAKFMDYEGYGKYLSENQSGRFIEGGFVYLKAGITPEELLEMSELSKESELKTMMMAQ